MEKRVFFFDLLRCVAALAVVAIHVLAPYRHELGVIPFHEWFSAITINGMSRWAVPVFIMITGGLMLTDERPFDVKYYLRRRLGKVLLPFIIWSVFYAYLSGWSLDGYDVDIFMSLLVNSYQQETYYHLGFFYYFIPLYFVIPFLQIFIVRVDNSTVLFVLLFWLLTTTLYLFRIDGFWSHELWLYSGYLLLGYVLYQKITLTKQVMICFVFLGLIGLAASVGMVALNSIALEKYTVGRWLSYKTINTVVAASMVFMLCRYYAGNLNGTARKIIVFISRYSLGIYILHPIFLWPLKVFYGLQDDDIQTTRILAHPLLVIPFWTIFSGAGALFLSWRVSKSAKIAWLLP
ncbi:acyltransferase [Vibrio sp. MA40-2]|uniref:acyltransferase n=1 Tax=Vibrio sp. MA40-2 TaxID=3391828 RepID=UPI0039A569DE